MIRFTDFSLTYPDAATPNLSDVNFAADEGVFCLVTGATGAGKTSLLGAINGLVPHFTGGLVSGSVVVSGRDTRDFTPGEMADLVGYVGQDPIRGFVAETVELELAYGMEQLGVDPATMRTRVEETLDLLGIERLRDRNVADLSGGEQQRVAIGSVLTTHPRVLVLDEPTSALDPAAAEEVLAALTRIVHDLGVTVVAAEHRLERIVQYADQVLLVANGSVTSGVPRDVMASSPLVPPVVDLGRRMGWQPLPLSVREGRSHARQLAVSPVAANAGPRGDIALAVERLSASYGPVPALRRIDLRLASGEVCVVMGRNGAGKSSLFWAMQGSLEPDRGAVVRQGDVGLVPQSPADLLFLTSVAAECEQADRDAARPSGSCRSVLDSIALGIDGDAHPADLSEGQRLALVLAVQLVGEPDVILLDEPTRGLDYRAKESLAAVLKGLSGDGRAVALSTHDVEFAAQVADRVVVLAQGEVVGDGRADEVLTASPLFAPQVAKVMAPARVLTVDAAMEAVHAG